MNAINGKELLLNSLRRKKVERAPWVPYAGIQAGSLKNYNAEELLKDGDKLYESLLAAHEAYRPDGMPVIFDLQVEAEIFGCDLVWAEKAPPSVSSHVLDSAKEINLTQPKADDGRIPLIVDVMKRLKAKIGGDVALYGLVTGPLTLAAHLRGMNIFIDMFEDPDYVQKLVDFCAETAKIMSEYYIGAGMDVIAVVDPMVSQISPDVFSQFLSAPFSDIFSFLKSKNVFSSFFVCGDATKNIEVMSGTKPDCISVDENIDIVEAKKTTDKFDIVISGNIPLTTVMLLGNQMDNQKYALDIIDSVGPERFILAPGCDMPYDIPPDNIIGITQVVRHPESAREFLKNYTQTAGSIDIELPNYDELDRPLLEVFTIDSAMCAACGYMKEAAAEMKEIFGDKIDFVEYKSILAENAARVKKLNITNLPSILLNGKLKYSSIIPDRKSFRIEIESELAKWADEAN